MSWVSVEALLVTESLFIVVVSEWPICHSGRRCQGINDVMTCETRLMDRCLRDFPYHVINGE
jgi:hypothetical protein